jgi:hypothetical protein
MRRFAVVPIMALALLLGACRDSTGPRSATMTGSWSGSSGGVTLNMILSEGSGGAITGTGSIAGEGGSLALTISGTHPHPNVGLTLASPGFDPMNFAGTFVNNNLVSGTLNGSGFLDFAITLHRQ